MLTYDWPAILADITDDTERQQCLMMLADELSDEGRQLIKERPHLHPVWAQDEQCWFWTSDDWWRIVEAYEDTYNRVAYPAILPEQIVSRITPDPEASPQLPPWDKAFITKADAWKALLEVIK